ncbi:type I restriction-modification system subunit M [Treponema sp. OMZ 788]|uniref:type I restriction-modification system subunit M n=1 Tax=Treponema sp. OMZ 788 TaxID=2563664 RepID=UPI0020A608FB|nr:type I restriction-modification system subunit M [Treponema sp. OMZ 788]UTC64502.1 type I restriction-modification system subunit M [Treponema sp. OMZ 788]
MSDYSKADNGMTQRAELHRKIWSIADNVRGAVDGWDFKQYILGILFYRFISENMTEFFNSAEHEAGDPDFDYAKISDKEAEADFRPNTVEDKGFFILPSQLFKNVAEKAKDNENLNTDLANIFKAIEGSAVGFASEDDIKGLFEDVDTTSNRLGGTVPEKNKRLTDILTGIAEINFGDFKKNDIDAFGDAYEYLISNYASNAGESGGAIICAPELTYIKKMDEVPDNFSQKDYSGLNLIDFYVLPHYLCAPFKKCSQEILASNPDLNICAINNSQAILINNGDKIELNV